MKKAIRDLSDALRSAARGAKRGTVRVSDSRNIGAAINVGDPGSVHGVSSRQSVRVTRDGAVSEEHVTSTFGSGGSTESTEGEERS